MPRGMPTSPEYDALVVGAGPAGLSATASLAATGLRVGCLSPRHPPRWPNTYGVWLDELKTAGFESHVANTWNAARVRLPQGQTHELDRTYALLDNASLRQTLRERADAGQTEWLEGVAVAVESDDSGGTTVGVETRSGARHTARLLVDATGHRDSPGAESGAPEPGYQIAFGRVLPRSRRPDRGGTMTLMNYEPPGIEPAADAPPSFLYSMEIADDRRLWEETVLVSRPAADYDLLRERLDRRLLRRGHDPAETIETERVMIPMGGSLPEVSPRRGVLPFGAAACMVHPATGYMIGRTLYAAPRLAESVAQALEAGSESSGARAVREGWRAIWPEERRRTRRLLTFGMEALVSMDGPSTASFFDAFFSLSQRDWRDYLSGTASPGRTARIMWRLFEHAPIATKGTLASSLLKPHARHVIGSIFA